jgi:hypothetical protein
LSPLTDEVKHKVFLLNCNFGIQPNQTSRV